MTHKELADNLTFLSALEMLSRLLADGLLTRDEWKEVGKKLKKKLRPTIQPDCGALETII